MVCILLYNFNEKNICKDMFMKLFRTSSLYVVSGHLKNPKPSNMSSKMSRNINYMFHNTFRNFEENIVHFTTRVQNKKSIYMFHRDCDPTYVIDAKVPYMM